MLTKSIYCNVQPIIKILLFEKDKILFVQNIIT